MFACSITPYAHDDVAKRLLKKLGAQGVDVINSAVFNGGFLTGGSFFDYREVKPDTDPELFAWRDKFNAICEEFSVKPAAVCVQFSFSALVRWPMPIGHMFPTHRTSVFAKNLRLRR